MALKMVHLIAYHCDDGVIVGIHENHVERDRDFEEAQKVWRDEIGGEGNSPTQRFDVLVPETMTNERINTMLKQVIMKATLLKLLDAILR